MRMKKEMRKSHILLYVCSCLTALILLAGTFMPMQVFADNNTTADVGRAVISVGNESVQDTFKSVDALLEWVEDMADDTYGANITIDLYTDWNTKNYGCILVEENDRMTVNLNGHMINRGEADASFYGSGDGQIFKVDGNGSYLTINGGDSTVRHNGDLVSDSLGGYFWVPREKNASKPLYGGLLTGGACDDSDGAGAISVCHGAYLYLNGVTIAGNLSDTWWGSYGHGGAIGVYGNGELHIADSHIVYNHAEGSGGGIYVGEDSGAVELYNTELSYNSSLENGGGFAADINGNKGNDMPSTYLILKIEKSKISYNRAAENGGGLYNYKEGGTIKIKECEITNNKANTSGGGIYDDTGATDYTINGASKISGNSAGEDGGGIYLEIANPKLNITENSVISNNKAGGNGGGIYSSGPWFTDINVRLDCDLSNMTIEGNTAGKSGGGFYSNIVSDAEIPLKFNNSVIRDNKANEGGGGIYLNDDSRLILNNSTVSGNTAAQGGGIYCADYEMNITSENIEYAVSGNTATKEGGGLYLNSTGEDVLLENIGFANNKAASGGGLYMGNNDDPLNIKNLKITGNSAETGGGIWFSGKLNLTDITAQNNTATTEGGGIYCNNTNKSLWVRLLGKVIVDSNTVNNARNNFVLKDTNGSQHLHCKSEDEKVKLSQDSHIGITVSGYDGSEKRLISQTQDFWKYFGENALNIVFSDSYAYSVVNVSDGYLALDKIASKFNVNIYTTSDTPTVQAADYGSTIELKSDDYIKTEIVNGEEVQSLPGYWTLEYDGKEEVLIPRNRVASFTMPGSDVSVRAHYGYVLSDMYIKINDDSTWDTIGTSTEDAAVNKLKLVNIIGVSYTTGIVLPAADTSTSISSVSLAEVRDTSTDELIKKNVTYTIKLNKELFDAADLPVDTGNLESSKVEVKTPFGTSSVDTCEYSVDDEGNLIVKAVVPFEVAGNYKIEIKAVDVNDTSKTPFDTYIQAAKASTSGETNTTYIDPPTEDGWSFASWEWDTSMNPQPGYFSPTKLVITSPTSDIVLYAKYKPLVNKIAFEMTALEAGKAFPTTLSACTVTNAAGTDMTGTTMNSAGVTWKKASGEDVGSKVSEDSSYKVTITTNMQDTETLKYEFAKNAFGASLNGQAAQSISFDDDANTQTFTFLVDTPKTESKVFANTVTEFSDIEIVDATGYQSKLAQQAEYSFDDGSTAKADITWGEPDKQVITQPDSFSVSGTYTDANGGTHNVTQDFVLKELDAPELTTASGTSGTGSTGGADGKTVTVVIKKPASADKLVYTTWSPGDEVAAEQQSNEDVTLTIDKDTVVGAYALYGNRPSPVQNNYITIEGDAYSIAVQNGKAYDRDKNEIISSEQGLKIKVVADEPEAGKMFDHWEIIDKCIELDDLKSSEIIFEMPGHAVKLQAVYVDKPVDKPVSTDASNKGVNTGDSAQLGVLVAVAVIALGCVIAILILGRKKNGK